MKTIKTILILIFWFTPIWTQAQDQTFSNLKKSKVNTFLEIYVYYDPKHCQLINKPSQTDSGFVDVLQTNLVPHNSAKHLIRYCEGPSGDPWFGFYRIERDTLIMLGSAAGEKLFIPGNGYLYSSEHDLTRFDLRSKYSISPDSIVEVEQPFYYVGIESEALEDITIYLDINKTKVVANLPKGSPVFIVANKGYRNYLLKTPFGLLGWFEIKYQYGQTELKGIYNGE